MSGLKKYKFNKPKRFRKNSQKRFLRTTFFNIIYGGKKSFKNKFKELFQKLILKNLYMMKSHNINHLVKLFTCILNSQSNIIHQDKHTWVVPIKLFITICAVLSLASEWAGGLLETLGFNEDMSCWSAALEPCACITSHCVLFIDTVWCCPITVGEPWEPLENKVETTSLTS